MMEHTITMQIDDFLAELDQMVKDRLDRLAKSAKAAERTKGKAQEVIGAVKNRDGNVIDDEEMAAKGKAKELEGEARHLGNS